MGKIRIKIYGDNGVNKLKGDDLTTEESLALIDLAKEIVYPSYNFHEVAQHHIETPIDSEPIGYPYETTNWSDESESIDDSQNVSANTVVEPVMPDAPTLNLDTEDEDEVTSPPVSMATTNVGQKLSEAFATQFGITSTDETEDKRVLSGDVSSQLEVLNKNFHETGVKYKLYGGEITPFYRVRWTCPKCNSQGNHYGPENIKQMFCYDCNASLIVRPANGRYPNRDAWGNFFLADELNMKFQRA